MGSQSSPPTPAQLGLQTARESRWHQKEGGGDGVLLPLGNLEEAEVMEWGQ